MMEWSRLRFSRAPGDCSASVTAFGEEFSRIPAYLVYVQSRVTIEFLGGDVLPLHHRWDLSRRSGFEPDPSPNLRGERLAVIHQPLARDFPNGRERWGL